MRCPDGAALAAWVDGEVVGPAADGVTEHLAGCARCQAAERTQRQVKRRTSLLGGPDPDDALLSSLLSLPQAEQDRAARQAHRERCGEMASPDSSAARFRLLLAGVGAAAWLVAATWSAPMGTAPTPASPTPGSAPPTSAGVPAGSFTPAGMPLGRWDAVRPVAVEQEISAR